MRGTRGHLGRPARAPDYFSGLAAWKENSPRQQDAQTTWTMAHNGATAEANEQLAPGGFHRFRPVSDAEEGPNVESNLVRPATDAIITVRIIKSFAFRSMKALVLKNVDLTTTTVDALKEMCKLQVRTSASFKPFRTWADKFGEYDKQG